MRPFRDLPIKRKLTLVLFLTAAAALVLAATALFAYELIHFRRTLIAGLESNAAIIADTGAAALEFDDPNAATEALAHLKVQPEIACAHIFDARGNVFARFENPGAGLELSPPTGERTGHRVERGAVVVFAPILSKGETIGVVSVRASLAAVRERMWTYLGTLLLVMAASLIATVFLSGKLQSLIADPLLKLAAVTRAVREREDYSLRAEPVSADEVGELVRGFNQMLAQIQARERALTESEQRFQQLAKAIREVFWLSDAETQRMIYVSPGFETIWGRSPAELYAAPGLWRETIHPADRERVATAAAAQHRAGQYDEEFRIIRRDGSVRWIRDRAFPVLDDRGRVFRIAGIAEDVTERKAAEEERDRFFEVSLDLLCVAGMDGFFKRVNPAFSRLLGYTAEELVSRPLLEFVHPEDRAATREQFSLFSRGVDVVDFANRYVCKNGAVRDLSWRCPAPAPGTERIFAVARDVTEQKIAERRLAESELRFRTLAEFAPIGIFFSAPNGDCQFVNREWCRITGRSAAAALGEGWKRVLHPDDAARVLEEWRATVDQGRNSSTEYRMTDAAGAVRWVVGTAICLRAHEGGIAGFLGTVLDITERKHFDAERQKFVSLIENSRDFIGMASLDEEVFYLNEAGLRMVGVATVADLKGKRIRDFLTAEALRVSTEQEMPAVLKTGHWEGENQLRHFQTGEAIDMEVSTFLIKAPTGEPLCLATVQRDVTERKRLQREILEISDRERNRLGQDIHDTICQMLISAGFSANALLQKLEEQGRPERSDGEKLVRLIEDTAEQAYQLSRGSFIAALDAEGLAPMLQELAANVRRQEDIDCAFVCAKPVMITNNDVANHVYRIAQEAVANAVKHAQPTRVGIRLTQEGRTIELAVSNDGKPFPPAGARGKGLGLYSMHYRAGMIGGRWEQRRNEHGETVVSCAFPAEDA